MTSSRITLVLAFLVLALAIPAWGTGLPTSTAASPTMTFYHHSVGTCYLDAGLADVAARHGYDLVPVEFPPAGNCPCDLASWFAANPSAMTGNVLIKSCFNCSNLWTDGEITQDVACYDQLRAQAAANGAKLFIISPTPYDRTEMEANGWRVDAQRGADLMDDLEAAHSVDPFLNANLLLRDPSLPYLALQYVETTGDSHPNDAGCQAVVDAIDAWLPNSTTPTQCTIGGRNYNDGQANPANVCQVCDVSANATAWSPNDGAACDDGSVCTGADSCSGGTCSVHATSLNCDDGNPCTIDSCAPATGCVHANNPAGCGDDNAPLTQKFPSAHVLVHYYCPDCSQAEKDHVAWCASMINHGDAATFQRLVPTHPEVADLVNIMGGYVQYVQMLTLAGQPNEQGDANMELLSQFAASHGYDEEDMYIHFTEPTTIENLGAKMVFDGSKVTLTDMNGATHVYDTTRAVTMIWGAFHYVFNWASEGWYQYIKYRNGLIFADMGGYSFDGLFQDAFNGPITDSFQGITSGGAIAEFGGLTPTQITAQGLDHQRLLAFQTRMNADFPGKVFLPNTGTYLESSSEQVMAAGDGAVTEGVNFPGTMFWKESWQVAEQLAAAGKYFTISSYWDRIPSNYAAGVYASGQERTLLHNAAFYWMAYEPGYIAFDVARACCDWSSQWPTVMETDLGSPTGSPYLAASGALANGWHWSLWAREYTKATVYYRGNNAWRDGNYASIGLGDATAASFSLPAGSQILRADGTWTAAPAQITHYDGFGFVVKKDSNTVCAGCLIGGICYANNQSNPSNICQVCTASRSATAWSDNDGTACNDGVYCNGADPCSPGSCSVHAGNRCPDDGLFCDGTESCNESTAQCVHSGYPCGENQFCDETANACGAVCAGCLIDGTCYANNQSNPANICQVCTVSNSTKAWSDNDGTACNDDVYCDGADTCSAGSCSVHAGNPCPDDGLFCDGAESCNESAALCVHAGNPCGTDQACDEMADACVSTCSGCLIDGYCYADNQSNPANICQVCTVSNSTTAWSDNDGTTCDDGAYCNGADTCSAGSCSAHAGNPCPDDGEYCDGTEVCSEAIRGCAHTGNPCHSSFFGWCIEWFNACL